MKAKRLILAIFLAAFLLGNTASFAQQEIQMIVSELRVFPVYKLSRVAVGEPAIADVTVLSAHEVMLIAKKEGETSLIIWDEKGQRSFNISVIERDLEKVAQRVRALLISLDVSGITVKIEGNKVYLLGEALNERDLEKIKGMVEPFPNAVNLVKVQERQPLVEIDVNVLEIAFDDMKKLGLDWSTSLPLTYSEGTGSKIDGKVPKLWKVFQWDRTGITAKLNFLIQNNQARTLANPKLITLSGKEASFLVGGEVPYLTVETDSRTKVEWKEYGVNLKIKPEVTAKNEIKATIEAEVIDLDWANAVTLSGYNIPAVKKRQAMTDVFLGEEDTIFLAGLIKNEDSEDVEKLPWLSKVPVLGELFKSTQFKNKRTELVIAITPRIIGEKATPDYLTSEMVKQEALLAAQRGFPPYSEEISPLTYYSHMIEDMITQNVIYPPDARQAQQEGIVKIDLYLLSDGQLKKAEIQESSGSSILDKAALAAVEDLAPYPSFPTQITQQELRLSVPVVFKSYVQQKKNE